MGLLGWGEDRPKNSVEIWKRNVTLSEFNINKFTLSQRQRIFSAYNIGGQGQITYALLYPYSPMIYFNHNCQTEFSRQMVSSMAALQTEIAARHYHHFTKSTKKLLDLPVSFLSQTFPDNQIISKWKEERNKLSRDSAILAQLVGASEGAVDRSKEISNCLDGLGECHFERFGGIKKMLNFLSPFKIPYIDPKRNDELPPTYHEGLVQENESKMKLYFLLKIFIQ